MENYSSDTHINVGTGVELSIRELAYKIKEMVGYEGAIVFDTDKPDGTLRKVLDTSILSSMGWVPQVSFEDGIKKAYQYYLGTLQGIDTKV